MGAKPVSTTAAGRSLVQLLMASFTLVEARMGRNEIRR